MGAKNKWQEAEEVAKRHEPGASQWLKLANDGDKAVIVFLGEPYPREVCFVDGKYTPFDDTLRAQGRRPSLRVALNIALYDTKEVRVFEQGVMLFRDLVQIRGKYGLDTWAFEVKRHGAAKDLKTTYSILPERQLTAEEQREFQALPLHDLAKLYGENGRETGAPTGARGADGGKDNGTTIDPQRAQTIAMRVRALPKEAVARFCQHFGIARLPDLPARQVEQAVAYLDMLTAELEAVTTDAREADPLA